MSWSVLGSHKDNFKFSTIIPNKGVEKDLISCSTSPDSKQIFRSTTDYNLKYLDVIQRSKFGWEAHSFQKISNSIILDATGSSKRYISDKVDEDAFALIRYFSEDDYVSYCLFFRKNIFDKLRRDFFDLKKSNSSFYYHISFHFLGFANPEIREKMDQVALESDRIWQFEENWLHNDFLKNVPVHCSIIDFGFSIE